MLDDIGILLADLNTEVKPIVLVQTVQAALKTEESVSSVLNALIANAPTIFPDNTLRPDIVIALKIALAVDGHFRKPAPTPAPAPAA